MTNPAVIWPYLFATDPVLRVTANSVSEDLDLDLSGSDPDTSDLMTALEDALETHSEITTATVSLQSDFKVRVVTDIASTLEWSHANTTLEGKIFGWTTTDTSSATTHDAPNEVGGLWRPGKPPETDTGDVQRTVGGVTTALSGKQRTSFFVRPYEVRDMFFGMLLQERAEERYALSGVPEGAFETAWLTALSYGRPMFYCPDEDDLDTYTEYVLRAPTERPIARDERFPALRWTVDLRLRRTA